jgi:hypothetical protein
MPDPQPQALHQPTRHPSRPTGRQPSSRPGRFRWLHRLPLGLCWHATVSTVPRVQGQGRPPGQTFPGGQKHDRGIRELCRQPHRPARATAHRRWRRPGHVPGGRLGSAEQEPSFFTVIVRRDQAEHASQSLSRAAGSWSWADSSSGAGPPRTAAPAPPSRWWPRSWGQACGGDGDHNQATHSPSQ